MTQVGPPGRQGSPTVLIGLSSGVDSSVSAWLLSRHGYNVIAVTLALAEPQDGVTSRSCCSPSLMTRAKAIADRLRIPHYAVDVREEFQRCVVDYFVAEYEAGSTPNPCAKCNSRVRFAAIQRTATRLGADFVATGHYARLTGPHKRLTRAIDRVKDQSYVLAEVEPGFLENCLFPLGELTKAQVRSLAQESGIADLVSEESQDLCFVPAGGYGGFLKSRLGERPGSVVDEEGNVVSSHCGTYNFTVGQKRRLGHGGGRSLYVVGMDAERNEILVSDREAAKSKVIRFSVTARHQEVRGPRLYVQVRSAGEALPGSLVADDTILLDEAELGVAPGQTIAAYHGDEVVFGGTILATRKG